MTGEYIKTCPFCGEEVRHRKPDAVSCYKCKRYYEPVSSRRNKMYECEYCGRYHYENSKVGQDHLPFKIGEFK